MGIKVATWNVNSLRVRLPQLLDWLAVAQPDVVGLQETKLVDEQFPVEELKAAGYASVFSGQKTYNGVAVLAREPPIDKVVDIEGFEDPQRRVLAVTCGALRIVNLYVPNGQSVDSDKYHYKLRWLAALKGWLAGELARHPRLVVIGDFNIAPDDRDVHDPVAWDGNVLVSPAERAALQSLLALGLADTFRMFDQSAGAFSWWDYRQGALRRNMGLRIDLILASAAAACRSCRIDKEPRLQERASDHTPVIAEFG